jgi:serine/threonine protein kinase
METVGNYTIYKNYKNKLGKGSYSSVYKGVYNGVTTNDLINGSIVAIKIINMCNLSFNDYQHVNSEVNVMNMLKTNVHPNVIKCFDTIQTQKYTYIIMEYCDCGDLSLIMTKPIKEKYARLYFCQLINGLKFLREHNLIHRDIKPKNILLTNENKILKIADFGFAKVIKESLMKEKICGSPLYMAPEIMNNNIYNSQTDLWSVGMILYEMIYGVHPYGYCKTFVELKDEINNTNIRIPPDEIENINISSECILLLQKLSQKQVDLRITWDEFFDNSWTKMENDIISEENSISPARSISMKSITIPFKLNNDVSEISGISPNEFAIMHSNINIIDDYYATDDNSPTIKINNPITDSCIFEMEFTEICTIKNIMIQ